MPKRKILHNFVRHINSHVFRAWSVERGEGGDTIAAYEERSERRCETAIIYFQNSNL